MTPFSCCWFTVTLSWLHVTPELNSATTDVISWRLWQVQISAGKTTFTLKSWSWSGDEGYAGQLEALQELLSINMSENIDTSFDWHWLLGFLSVSHQKSENVELWSSTVLWNTHLFCHDGWIHTLFGLCARRHANYFWTEFASTRALVGSTGAQWCSLFSAVIYILLATRCTHAYTNFRFLIHWQTHFILSLVLFRFAVIFFIRY